MLVILRIAAVGRIDFDCKLLCGGQEQGGHGAAPHQEAGDFPGHDGYGGWGAEEVLQADELRRPGRHQHAEGVPPPEGTVTHEQIHDMIHSAKYDGRIAVKELEIALVLSLGHRTDKV